jgi:putative N6-adenine-specific DNA methylase
MCGSGTLAIEAALLAANIPSMVERSHFAFKNFKSFIPNEWEEVLNNVNRKPKKLDFSIIASDSDAAVLQKAKRNSKSAPIGNMIQFELSDFRDITPPTSSGTLICNPPYGERMGEEIEKLYSELGDFFKNKMTGYSCWIISSNTEAMKHVGLKPSKKEKVFNGSLECTFRRFDIFEGTKKIKHTPSIEDNNVSQQSKKSADVIQENQKSNRKKTETPPKKTVSESRQIETEAASKYKSYTPKYLAKEDHQIEKNNRQEEKETETKKEKLNLQNNKEKIEKLRKYRHREDD